MPKSFVIRKVAFFELIVSNYLLRPSRSKLKACTKIFQNTSCNLVICFLRFFILYNTRKFYPKTFIHWRESLFFSKTCGFNDFPDPKGVMS